MTHPTPEGTHPTLEKAHPMSERAHPRFERDHPRPDLRPDKPISDLRRSCEPEKIQPRH